MNTILTLDHTIYLALGCGLEYAAALVIARIRLLAKAPTQTLSQDAITLVEKLIESHLATASAVQKVAAISAAPANANTTTPST